MDLMEQLLCPQVCMDVEDTPLEIEAPAEEPGESPEAELSTLPIELRVRMILDNEFNFVPEQVPLPLLPSEADTINGDFSHEEFLKDAKLHCTVCNRHIGTSLVEQLGRYIHPELNVLMCQQCFKFYGSGTFDKDEDGSELYCKWCGQGGTVMCCSDCPLVFCQNCVKRNLGIPCLNRIKNSDNWQCFKCNPEQLRKFHIISHVLHEYATNQLNAAVGSRNMFMVKNDFSTCCKKRKRVKDSDDENDEFLPTKIPKKKLRSKSLASTPQNDVGKVGSGFLQRALNTLNAGPPNTPDTLFQSLKLQSAVTAPGTNQPVLKFRVAPVGQPAQSQAQSLPTLAQLMPTIFTSISAPNPAPAARAHFQYARKSAPPQISAKQTVKTAWLTNSMASAKVQAQALIREVEEVQKLTKNFRGYSELASIHNQLQRAMATCTNRLIASRREMHKEFLRFLKVNNISHSSVPSNPTSALELATTSRPVKKHQKKRLLVTKKSVPVKSVAPKAGVVAEIDLCDDDDDAMITHFGANSNSVDDPLAISDDDEDYDNVLSTTTIVKPKPDADAEGAPVLDLTDDVAVVPAPEEPEGAVVEGSQKDAQAVPDEVNGAVDFDFVREMQNEIFQKLAVESPARNEDAPSPSSVSASLTQELIPAAKKDADAAPGVDALEAIMQLTETIAETITESQMQAEQEQDIDSNDNVKSPGQTRAADEDKSIIPSSVTPPIENEPIIPEDEDKSVIPSSVTPPIEDDPNIPEDANSLEKDDEESMVTFNDAYDRPIDEDMVPAD